MSNWKNSFIGREIELKLLRHTYEELLKAEKSEPRLISFLGESGLGKTRILQEFYTWLSQTHDERDPKGYWPDYLAIEHRNLLINPNMEEYAQRREGLPFMPFLWWGIRCHGGTHQRNQFQSSGSFVVDGQRIINKHFGLLWEAERAQKVKRGIKSNILKTGMGMVGLGALGDHISEAIGLVTDGKDILDGVKNTAKGLKSARRQARREHMSLKAKDSIPEDAFYLDYEDAPEAFEIKDLEEASQKLLNDLIKITSIYKNDLHINLPIVILVDDAQWIEPKSLEFLRNLTDSCFKKNFKLLLIATHWEQEWKEFSRNETGLPKLFNYADNIGSKVELHTLSPLNGLSEIIKQAAPGISPDQLVTFQDLAGGNPLLMQEILHWTVKPKNFLDGDCNGAFTERAIRRLTDKRFELHNLIESRFEDLRVEIQNTLAYVAHLGGRAPRFMMRCLTDIFGYEDVDELLRESEDPSSFLVADQSGILEFPQTIYGGIALSAWEDLAIDHSIFEEAEKRAIKTFLKDPVGYVDEEEEELILLLGLNYFPATHQKNHSIRYQLILDLYDLLSQEERWKDIVVLINEEIDFLCGIDQSELREEDIFEIIAIGQKLTKLGVNHLTKRLMSSIDTNRINDARIARLWSLTSFASALALGEHEFAIEIAEKSTVDHAYSCEIDLLISRAYIAQGNYADAKSRLERCIGSIGDWKLDRTKNNSGSLNQLSEAHSRLATCWMADNNYNEAEQAYLESLHISIHLSNLEQALGGRSNAETLVRGHLSKLYDRQQRYDDVIEVLEPAVQCVDKFSDELNHDISKVKTYCVTKSRYAMGMLKLNRTREALKIIDEVIDSVSSYEGKIDLTLMRVLSKCYETQEKCRLAVEDYTGCIQSATKHIQYAKNAIQYYEPTIEEILHIASLHETMAGYAISAKNRKKSFNEFKKACIWYEKVPESRWTSYIFSQNSFLHFKIANHLEEDGNDELAFAHRLKSVNYQKQCSKGDIEDKTKIALSLNRLSACALKLQKYEVASESGLEALRVIDSTNNLSPNVITAKLPIFGNLSKISRIKKCFKESITWRQKEVDSLVLLNKEIGYKNFKKDIKIALSAILDISFESEPKDTDAFIFALRMWVDVFADNPQRIRLKYSYALREVLKLEKNVEKQEILRKLLKQGEKFGLTSDLSDKTPPIVPIVINNFTLPSDAKNPTNGLVNWVFDKAPDSLFQYNIKTVLEDNTASKFLQYISKTFNDNLELQASILVRLCKRMSGIPSLNKSEWGRVIVKYLYEEWQLQNISAINSILHRHRAFSPFWGKAWLELISVWVESVKARVNKAESLDVVLAELNVLISFFKFPPRMRQQVKEQQVMTHIAELFNFMNEEFSLISSKQESLLTHAITMENITEVLQDEDARKKFSVLKHKLQPDSAVSSRGSPVVSK